MNFLQDQSCLHIRLFGGSTLHKGAQSLPRTRTRSGQWLLALLALRADREVERAWLATALWPDSAEPQALYNLRRSLSELRHALGEDAFRLASPTPRTLMLNTSGAFVDTLEFDRAMARGDTASLEQGVGLYCGPLLEGCPADWAWIERQRYEQAYLAALDTLALQATARQDHVGAAHWLSRALACAPLREATLQALMRSLAETGDTAGALAAYRRFRLRLHHDLQSEPEAETVALYRDLHGAKGKSRISAAANETQETAALHSVPHPLTPLIGRETEIRSIVECLREARLVTLVGMGGVGKTRLAIAVAHQVARRYADGVWYLDLAALTDAAQMSSEAAELLGAQTEAECATTETLCRFLARKSLLLILDNCEHLVDACAAFTIAVLARCPNVSVLSAGRQALGVYGERLWRVPGLSLPESGGSSFSSLTQAALLEQFAHSDAARLFVGAAIAANHAFCPTLEQIPHILRICCLLDGIPFALELAAAWTKSLPVAHIADRLDNRFEFLVGGPCTAHPRQQTLRAALDWSYHLLEAAEQTLLRRLAVFSGGWTLAAAFAVCTAQDENVSAPQMETLLTRLVDKSLVTYEERAGEGRYRLLETTRAYASELCLPEEWEEGQRRHAAFFLQLARQAQEKFDLLGRDSVWLPRLRMEQENLRAALTWWRRNALVSAAPLLLLLRRADLFSYHSEEARAWIDRLQAESRLPATPDMAALACEVGKWADWLGYQTGAVHLWEKSLEAATACADTSGKANALLHLGYHGMASADSERAESYLQASQACFEELGELHQSAIARNRLGLLIAQQGDSDRARRLVAVSLAIGRQQNDPTILADALDVLGYICWQHKDYKASVCFYEELVELLREPVTHHTANALRHLGAVKGEQGDFARAWQHLEAAQEINRQVGFLPGEGWDLYYMADLAFHEGRQEAAWQHLDSSLHIFEKLGEIGSLAGCLRRWARFETECGRWERALCLWSHMERLLECYQHPVPATLRADFDAFITRCQAQLTAAQFQTAWKQGQTLPTTQIVEYARAPLQG